MQVMIMGKLKILGAGLRGVAVSRWSLHGAKSEELTYDSAHSRSGSLFFCPQEAQKHDGHEFAAHAYSRGCHDFVS